MNGYGIYVKNDLLDPKHVKNMQVSQKTNALWMYLWFLDKITSIDRQTGLGIVLGGKPFKLDEFDLVDDIKTKRKMFRCLVDTGYLKVTRTPYGQIVWVTKAVKIFGNKVRYSESPRGVAPQPVGFFRKLFAKVFAPVENLRAQVIESGMSVPESGRSPTHEAGGQVSKRGRSNKDSTERQDKDNTTPAASPQAVGLLAQKYLDHWNAVRKKNYTSVAAIKANLGYWLTAGYKFEQILQAVEATKYHEFFRKIDNPVVILRRKNKAMELVDHIGELLNDPNYQRELQRRESRKKEQAYYQSGGTTQQTAANQERLAAIRQGLATKMSP